jgi:hypothetical protein
MAIVTRFYVEKGPSNQDLQRFVNASVSATERFRSPVCILQYDDATPGIAAALDEYMDGLGYDADTVNLSYVGFARPGNPGAVAGRAFFFAKTIGGVTNWYARTDDGAVIQITPVQLATGDVAGLVPAWTSGTTVTIGAGKARDSADSMTITLAAPQLVNAAVVGANGIDAGALANNNWYYLFVIADSTGVLPTAGLISLQTGAPAMPVGYDTRRRIGSMRTDGAASFRNFQVDGTQRHHSVQFRDALNNRQRLTGGNATVVTLVGLGQAVPATANFARLQVQQRGTVTASLYDDPTQTIGNPQRTIPAGGCYCDVIRVSGARDMAYANAAAGGLLDIWVTGYEEDL